MCRRYYQEISVIANSTCSILVHFCSKIKISQRLSLFIFFKIKSKLIIFVCLWQNLTKRDWLDWIVTCGFGLFHMISCEKKLQNFSYNMYVLCTNWKIFCVFTSHSWHHASKNKLFLPKMLCNATRRKYVTQVSLHLQGADDVACLNEMSISTRRVSFLGLASSAKSGRKKTCWSKKNAISNFIFVWT